MRSSISLLLFSILLALSACDKEPPADNKNTLSYKKDGVTETMIPVYCSIKPNVSIPTKTDFVLTARTSDFRSDLAITVQVNGGFTTGTYETVIDSGNYPAIADYFVDQGQPNERDFTIENAPAKPNCRFTVTITSIESTLVKGTFSANYLYDPAHNESIIISEGSFVAKRH